MGKQMGACVRYRLRIIFAIILFVITVCVVRIQVYAVDDCNDTSCLNTRIADYQKKINELQGQQKTLSSTIKYLENKSHLTESEIKKTQYDINILEKEIDVLSNRIGGLEISLKRLSEILIARIQENYKRRSLNPTLLIFSSQGFGDFVAKLKYLQMAQQYTQSMIHDAEEQKVSYDAEKKLKEKKQVEVEQVRKKLESQKIILQQQRQQKDSLLKVTQNDEKKYQSLLQQAQDQLLAFQRYVQSQGGAGLLTNQTKCDGWGCYYNQRDTQWGSKGIGLSGEPMNEFGCLVTSMAMISTHYGKKLTPSDIAGSLSPFQAVNKNGAKYYTAYMIQGTWSVNGVTTTRKSIGSNLSSADEELNAGRPVIAGLYSSSTPGHFIVIKAKENGNYIMNDPFMENGKDKLLTDKYKTSDVKRIDMVRVQ